MVLKQSDTKRYPDFGNAIHWNENHFCDWLLGLWQILCVIMLPKVWLWDLDRRLLNHAGFLPLEFNCIAFSSMRIPYRQPVCELRHAHFLLVSHVSSFFVLFVFFNLRHNLRISSQIPPVSMQHCQQWARVFTGRRCDGMLCWLGRVD